MLFYLPYGYMVKGNLEDPEDLSLLFLYFLFPLGVRENSYCTNVYLYRCLRRVKYKILLCYPIFYQVNLSSIHYLTAEASQNKDSACSLDLKSKPSFPFLLGSSLIAPQPGAGQGGVSNAQCPGTLMPLL